ncbi:hypothetical protein P154DRAFT_518268 [Amniculicola lignicola CBS 123094]|uniref:PARG catalytic Macro domain-containing protein n=1 Tax=Amniculicola lignicola CBS 123094 TaxID=1392246 RepID=A0A6A5WWE9_9PLEO|nr:hypothetical protein P154DRAFT_518268 [Amniculicola lignicola CBS 123094]
MSYILPTHPSLSNDDPLGVLDVEAASQSAVLDRRLETALTQLRSTNPVAGPSKILPSLIEDIAYTVHGNGSIDTTALKEFLHQQDPIPSCYESILSILLAAQNLPMQFPSNTLAILKEDGDTVTCNGAQINSLLAHQLLGTLNQSKETTWGIPCFTEYYKSGPAHSQAVQGYLTTLLSHFASGGYKSTESFTFTMHTASSMPNPALCKRVANISLNLVTEESEPSDAPGTPFVLVAAHSEPGPGATATQEERLQNASLALSTSALFSPKLPDDGAVVTSAFPVHAMWKGHNRTARLDSLIAPQERSNRHYILADALMLDELEDNHGEAGVRDLQDGRVEREVKKLYAAFSGASKINYGDNSDRMCVIETGPWGCGAFGGNVLVKTVCIMIAAALACVQVRYSLLQGRTQDVDHVQKLMRGNWTTAQLWGTIRSREAKQARSDIELCKCFGN